MPLDGGVSILVVEDNQSDAELVVEGLEQTPTPMLVKVVGDGQAALDFLREARDEHAQPRPDIVLLDLNLPRRGGLETLTELKNDDELRAIPVIVLTTSKSAREINGCYERGAAAVLNKPMRLAEHRAMLRSLGSFWLEQVLLPREAV